MQRENAFSTLEFYNVAEDAKSLAIIVEDPDIPRDLFVHWIVWDIPANVSRIEEDKNLPYPKGLNDLGVIGYRGPCPPLGAVHRYYFRVYAIDTFLNLPEGATRDDFLNAISGHAIAEATLVGKYGY